MIKNKKPIEGATITGKVVAISTHKSPQNQNKKKDVLLDGTDHF